MNYIKINEFEGPLDLLLHLIKKSEVEIWDISITDVTNQYLNYITAMEELNLTIASEYLVMAAELIELKSRMLLPKPKKEEDDEEELIDPKEALIQRLLEYKKYKEITPYFKELEEKRSEMYTKLPENLKQYSEEEILTPDDDVSPELLLEAFKKFLERKKLDQPLKTKITRKEITIESRVDYIKTKLKGSKPIKFENLFEVVSKEYIITTFLALLELVKEKQITLIQEHNFNDIYVSERSKDDE